MEPLSGHKKIVPTPHGGYLGHLAMHMGGIKGSTAGSRDGQEVRCSVGQHQAIESPLATNRFQATQPLQDSTRHLDKHTDPHAPWGSDKIHVTSSLLSILPTPSQVPVVKV